MFKNQKINSMFVTKILFEKRNKLNRILTNDVFLMRYKSSNLVAEEGTGRWN